MLLVVVPVIVLTLYFGWRYRETNTQATYAPKWSHSTPIEIVVWSIPCVIVAVLAVLIWKTTHELDPYKPIASQTKPVRVDVIALNWKWLFIYPDYGVASVNRLQIPVDTPVEFRLTAESLMNSFFIPSSAAWCTRWPACRPACTVANHTGTYHGLSAAYSGEGFSDMRFDAIASSRAEFDAWVAQARRSPLKLDPASYRELEQPSTRHPVTVYANATPPCSKVWSTASCADRRVRTSAATMSVTPLRARDRATQREPGRRRTVIMLGKLNLDAIPTHEPIIMGTLAAVAILGAAMLAAITRYGKWTYLWKEWITSVDHKKIGVMYILLALVMLLRGFADAIMMRTQQAIAAGGEAGYLPPHHYDQIFTAHGVIAIFFVATPLIVGLMNVIVPLQIGARDVAYPFVNSLSFWLSAVGAVLVMLSMFVGDFAATGWVAYPPLSGRATARRWGWTTTSGPCRYRGWAPR